MPPADPFVLIDDSIAQARRLFAAPEQIVCADQPGDVMRAFDLLERARRAGRWVAGYLSYELGYALEPRLGPLMPRDRHMPLLQFGIFSTFSDQPALRPSGEGRLGRFAPDWSLSEYRGKFARVAEFIAAGDAYQVNLTFPLRGRAEGDLFGLYGRLRHRQPVAHGAYVSLDGPAVLSLSPELFFAVEGGVITCKPMKGTAPRGREEGDDRRAALELSGSEKQRAENLMIVDLIRNDLSRVARVGSVHVPRLFQVETYPTLHQLTSTVRAALPEKVTLIDLVTALFPCGSVTGAPKIRAMEIIRELETTPRGVYCGAIGFIGPDGTMRFNVAIRTLVVFSDRSAMYNVGSGIVADSSAEAEYEECLLKSRFLEL
jgi:para-aminobenzoate synthetase component I